MPDRPPTPITAGTLIVLGMLCATVLAALWIIFR